MHCTHSPSHSAPTLRFTGLEEHLDSLRRFLSRRMRDANDVDDLVQEVVLRAARFRGHNRDGRRTRGWLLRIAGNMHADWLRRRLGDPGTGLGAGECDADLELPPGPPHLCMGSRRVPFDVASAALRRHWSRLSPGDRAALDGYYHQGRACAELADELCVARTQVKVRLFRARARLREWVFRDLEAQLRWA
ncbi:MAG: RNA polymerase sigma factor [Planctomycetota bacterium]